MATTFGATLHLYDRPAKRLGDEGVGDWAVGQLAV